MVPKLGTDATIKLIPWWLWIVMIALLIVATQKLPYAYYQIMKIVVFGFAATTAYLEWDSKIISRAWSIVFGFIAIIFNPISPIYFSRHDIYFGHHAWYWIDIAFAVVFTIHLIFARLSKSGGPARHRLTPKGRTF
jgi:hypothetical protein